MEAGVLAGYSKSADIFRNNRKFIPGAVVSVNRATEPEIVFVKGRGAYIWDADGNGTSITTPPSLRTCLDTTIRT